MPDPEGLTATQLIEKFQEARSLQVSSVNSDGEPVVVRFTPPPTIASGYEDGIIIDRELFLTVKNLRSFREWHDLELGQRLLVFCFHLQGHRTVETNGYGTFELKEARFAVFYQDTGCWKRSTWQAGEHELSVMIGFSLDRPPQAVSTALKLFDPQSPTSPKTQPSFSWRELPLTPEMATAAWHVVFPSVHSEFLHAYWRAKALELLCLGADALCSTKYNEARTTESDTRPPLFVKTARETLLSSLNQPPPVSMLAKAAQVSPTKLSREFRIVYGSTIQSFLRRARMERARALLATTDLPIKEVAYRVGFHHTSNFCTAFRREFHQTPDKFRELLSEKHR